MTSSEYWGWLVACHDNGSRKARRAFIELTMRFGPERYHEQVWTAIWFRTTESDRTAATDPEAQASADRGWAELEWFAQVIRECLGDEAYLERFREFRKLDPQTRRQLEWAIDRHEAGRLALQIENDPRSALARLEAGWSVVEKVGSGLWKARFQLAMAECHAVLGNRAEARALIEASKGTAPPPAPADLLEALRRVEARLAPK